MAVMNLAQVMAAHGKALGPLGVAVYAWIEANPGSTFKEVADGLGMGESTVKKCVRQFEALGIAERQYHTTPNGLREPTRITVKDPGTIERGVSDNPVTTETPLPQNPVTIELPENTGAGLSDPGTIERGTRGTPLAPSKAKNTSTETEANASGAKRGEGIQAYIGRLLQFRRNDLGVKKLPVEQGEAAAAKWMHSQGWPLGSVGWCYRALKRQRWRGAPVTLITVKTHYLDWKQGKLSDGKRTQDQPRTQYGGKPPVTRNFDKYPARTG
jgi:hypothetical protein